MRHSREPPEHHRACLLSVTGREVSLVRRADGQAQSSSANSASTGQGLLVIGPSVVSEEPEDVHPLRHHDRPLAATLMTR
jgi:hypothetical protein